MIAPIFDELARTYNPEKVVFLKVDVDDTRDISSRYQIKSMPTFLFIKGNSVVDRFSGANVEMLKSTLDKYV